MTRALLDGLMASAEEVRAIFNGRSDWDDAWEEVEEVVPCSETTAVVTYRKASGLRTVFLFIWIAKRGGLWTHFLPTYEHLYGLKNERLYRTMDRVEESNARIHQQDREDAPERLTVVTK